jgi:hypothetical protein
MCDLTNETPSTEGMSDAEQAFDAHTPPRRAGDYSLGSVALHESGLSTEEQMQVAGSMGEFLAAFRLAPDRGWDFVDEIYEAIKQNEKFSDVGREALEVSERQKLVSVFGEEMDALIKVTNAYLDKVSFAVELRARGAFSTANVVGQLMARVQRLNESGAPYECLAQQRRSLIQ